MRSHLHFPDKGMSRREVSRVLFSVGLTDKPLTEREVYDIEQRALRKLRRALAPELNALHRD